MTTNPVDEIRDRARGDAYLEAVKAGTAPHADSPGGKSLLASYQRWQQQSAAKSSDARALGDLALALESIEAEVKKLVAATTKARTSALIDTPVVKEEAARRLGDTALRSALVAGSEVADALGGAFKIYKGHGGRLTEAAWRRAITQRQP
jgi:hypothetical protein